MPRPKRGLLAAAWMVGGIVPVFVVLNLALQNRGFSNNGMTPIVWVGVSVFGLIFVHGETLATALLVTLAHQSVTVAASETSSIQSSQEIDHHEASTS